MLTLRVLGAQDLPDVTTRHPVYYGGLLRQDYEGHIAVGARDVTPGNFYGYDWTCTVSAYRTWDPGRHGTSCAACPDDWSPCPAGERCGHLWLGAPLSDTWGTVYTTTFDVRTLQDTLAGRRFDPEQLTRAIAEADAALSALPPSPLPWTAYGPTHPYGHWATREQASGWLTRHLRDTLAHDPNLGSERQAAASAGADQIAAGAGHVTIGAKIYGIRAADGTPAATIEAWIREHGHHQATARTSAGKIRYLVITDPDTMILEGDALALEIDDPDGALGEVAGRATSAARDRAAVEKTPFRVTLAELVNGLTYSGRMDGFDLHTL